MRLEPFRWPAKKQIIPELYGTVMEVSTKLTRDVILSRSRIHNPMKSIGLSLGIKFAHAALGPWSRCRDSGGQWFHMGIDLERSPIVVGKKLLLLIAECGRGS